MKIYNFLFPITVKNKNFKRVDITMSWKRGIGKE